MRQTFFDPIPVQLFEMESPAWDEIDQTPCYTGDSSWDGVVIHLACDPKYFFIKNFTNGHAGNEKLMLDIDNNKYKKCFLRYCQFLI